MIAILNEEIPIIAEIIKLYLVYKYIFNRNLKRSWWTGLTVVIITLIITGVYVTNSNILLLFIKSNMSVLVLCIMDRDISKKAVMCGIVSLCAVNITDIVVWIITCYLFLGKVVQIEEGTLFILIREIYLVIVQLIIVMAVVKMKLNKGNNIKYKYKFADLLCIILSFICCIFLVGGSYGLLVDQIPEGGVHKFAVILMVCGLFLFALSCLQVKYHNSSSFYQEMFTKEEELSRLRVQYYDRVGQELESMNAVNHEYYRHLNTIRRLCEMESHDDAIQYIDELLLNKKREKEYVNCGNKIVSLVLSDAKARAEQSDIEFLVRGNVPDNKRIPDTKMCELMGNIMDNALQACMRVECNSSKYINVEFCVNEDKVIITVSNTCSEECIGKNKRLKTSKKGKHGYGMKNVVKIVHEYGGQIQWWAAEYIFHLEIIIKM